MALQRLFGYYYYIFIVNSRNSGFMQHKKSIFLLNSELKIDLIVDSMLKLLVSHE